LIAAKAHKALGVQGNEFDLAYFEEGASTDLMAKRQ
jgi:hypothetical protein